MNTNKCKICEKEVKERCDLRTLARKNIKLRKVLRDLLQLTNIKDGVYMCLLCRKTLVSNWKLRQATIRKEKATNKKTAVQQNKKNTETVDEVSSKAGTSRQSSEMCKEAIPDKKTQTPGPSVSPRKITQATIKQEKARNINTAAQQKQKNSKTVEEVSSKAGTSRQSSEMCKEAIPDKTTQTPSPSVSPRKITQATIIKEKARNINTAAQQKQKNSKTVEEVSSKAGTSRQSSEMCKEAIPDKKTQTPGPSVSPRKITQATIKQEKARNINTAAQQKQKNSKTVEEVSSKAGTSRQSSEMCKEAVPGTTTQTPGPSVSPHITKPLINKGMVDCTTKSVPQCSDTVIKVSPKAETTRQSSEMCKEAIRATTTPTPGPSVNRRKVRKLYINRGIVDCTPKSFPQCSDKDTKESPETKNAQCSNICTEEEQIVTENASSSTSRYTLRRRVNKEEKPEALAVEDQPNKDDTRRLPTNNIFDVDPAILFDPDKQIVDYKSLSTSELRERMNSLFPTLKFKYDS